MFREQGGDILVTATADFDDLLQGETLMLEIAGELDAMNETVMRAARAIAIEDMEERFATQTSPDNDPWAALDPEYLKSKRAAGFPDSILQRTGKTKEAATDPLAWRIVDNTLFFDPSVLPSTDEGWTYGLLHQEGTGEGNAGARARILSGGYTKEEIEEYRSSDGGFGIGSGLALPARPWIGMSEVAEARLWNLFEKWFNAIGEGGGSRFPFVHPSGTVQSRTPTGQFGSNLT